MHKIVAVVVALVVVSSGGERVSADFILPDNVEVQGSLCVGRGGLCSSPEVFSTDMKLKSTSPTLSFESTSASPHTWEISGTSELSVFDLTNNTTPFVIQSGAPSESLQILSDGTVLLGSDVVGNGPSQTGKLHLFGDATQDVFGSIGPNPDLSTGAGFHFGYSGNSFGRGSGFLNVRPAPAAVAPNPSLRFLTANEQRMIIDNLGNVGIGDFGAAVGTPGTSPLAKLHVQGNVFAEGSITSAVGILVNGTPQVPDYVFAPEYKLLPLNQLAAYVAKERHLPDVPSAQDIKAQGGINLGDMQMTLLKKIEELTLYTVEQEKTIAALTTAKQHQDQTITALTEALTEVRARLAVLEQRR